MPGRNFICRPHPGARYHRPSCAGSLIAAAAEGRRLHPVGCIRFRKLDDTLLSDLRSKGIRIRKYGQLISGESCTWGAGCIPRSRSWTTIPRSWADQYLRQLQRLERQTARLDYAVVVQGETARQLNRIAGNAGKTRIRSMNFLPASRIECRSRDCQPTTAFPSGSHRTTSCAVSRKRRLRTGRRSDKHGTALCSSAATSCQRACRRLLKKRHAGVAISLIVSAESDVGWCGTVDATSTAGCCATGSDLQNIIRPMCMGNCC